MDDQSTWVNVTMVAINDNYYSGIIPQKVGGGRVYFDITARDNVGYWTTEPSTYYDVFFDSAPPSFYDVTVESGWPVYAGDAVQIRAEVYDDTGIAQVILSYSLDEGSTWTNVTMEYSHDNYYTANIPEQGQGTHVIYKVYASDTSGNWEVADGYDYTVSSEGTVDQIGLPWQILFTAVVLPAVLCLSVICICRRRRKPRKRLEYPAEPVYYESLPEAPTPIAEAAAVGPNIELQEEKVEALRGCQAVGGQFEYKVKIKNDTNSVITNVNVTIVAFPSDCMEIVGPTSKSISRIEPDGFRSPQFIFSPTKDCVEGRIQASVTYIDYQDKPHTIHVEPYTIRSVCDLLKPLEATMDEFDLMLIEMETTSDERMMDWNPQVLYSKAEKLLPARNFHILDKKSDIKDGLFRGMIRGLAEGKYTGKKVAVRIQITGKAVGRESKVTVEGLGEDIAMLPTTIEELEVGIDSWICLNCGGALAIDEVTKLSSRVPVGCRFCGHTLTISLYRK
jgi:hypothetical protein